MNQPLISRDALFDIPGVVEALATARRRWRADNQHPAEPGQRELPSRETVERIVDGLRGVLFPLRLGPPDLRPESENLYVGHALDAVLHSLLEQVRLELSYQARHDPALAPMPPERAVDIVRAFAQGLADIRALLDSDVSAAFAADPAAKSVDEVLLCYPGIQAMIHHRIAHSLHGLGVPMLARLVAELAHGATGIDIHPGASVGAGFFIDHGTGVVIGETARIGRNVQLFQAVTLGARSFPSDETGHAIKGLPRHPLVEDDVVIYAGATILGRVTIGRGAVIGGNVWIAEDVPPFARVTQASSRRTTPRTPPPAALSFSSL